MKTTRKTPRGIEIEIPSGPIKRPLNDSKFTNLIAEAAEVYGVDIERLNGNGKKARFVIKNEVLFYSENVNSRTQLAHAIKKVSKKRINVNEIIRCCWDKSLYIIRSKPIYDLIKKNEKNSFSLNELCYGDKETKEDGDVSSTDKEPEGEIAEGENVGVKIGSRKQNSNQSCEEQSNCCIPIEKCKIQIGVVDFGWGDHHAEMIKSIIHNEYKSTQLHDYNLVASFPVASAAAICCQIARAINERMDILNMSIGYYSNKENLLIKKYLKKASRAGVLIVCSSGNSNNDNSENNHWPSNYSKDNNNVITVSSCRYEDGNLRKTYYSNYESKDATDFHIFTNGMFPYPSHVHLNSRGDHITYGRGTSFSTAYIVAKIAKLFKKYGKAHYLNADGFLRQNLVEDLSPDDRDINLYPNSILQSCRSVE